MRAALVSLVFLAVSAAAAAQWLTLQTPGIPRTADGTPDLSAPAPRMADGRPSLDGLWRAVGAGRSLFNEAQIQPWARQLMAERELQYYAEGPHFKCLPVGPGAIITSGEGSYRRLVHGPSVLAILNSDMTFRQIFIDGRALEEDPLPIWMGYSVGRWEGDTLVVESNGYNDKTWLHNEGLSHTESLRITERFTRTDFGHIRVEVTYDDPGTFTAPQQIAFNLRYATDDEMLEVICAEAPQGHSDNWVGEKVADALETTIAVDPAILAKYVGTYRGYWLDNITTVAVTLDGADLYLARNGGEPELMLAQSQTSFVCGTCRWGQPYVFTQEGENMATQVREVQVSGAWIFERVD